MIYKYVTSREVIDKFFGDTNYDEDIPFADVIRWIAEALDMIHVKGQYIRKVSGGKINSDLMIKNHKAKLPCDFFKLEQLAINGMPAIPSKNSMFHMVGTNCCSHMDLMDNIQSVYQDNFGNDFVISPFIANNMTSTSALEYDINDNYITTNVKEGEICMAYMAYPVDDEGFPMIPDDVYYLRAVAAYITRMMDYRTWRRTGSRSDKEMFEHSEREWIWYVSAATASGQRPDSSTMERLVDSFVSLIPKLPIHNRFYKF